MKIESVLSYSVTLALTALLLTSASWAGNTPLTCDARATIGETITLEVDSSNATLTITSSTEGCSAALTASTFTDTAAQLESNGLEQLEGYAKAAGVNPHDIDHVVGYGAVDFGCEAHGSQGLGLLYDKNDRLIGKVMIVDQTAYPCAAPSRIENFSQVTPEIYRGGRPQLSPVNQMSWLSSVGIKTDIDLQGGDIQNPGLKDIMSWLEPGETPENIALEKQSADSLQMSFINMPLNSLTDITRTEGQEIDQVLLVMNDPKMQPIFVHCEHGEDRTGLVIALYRVEYQNWSVKAAHDEMVAQGHGALNQIVTGDMDEYFYKETSRLRSNHGVSH